MAAKTIGHILQSWENPEVYYEVIREFCEENGEVYDYLPLQQASTYELAVSIAKRTKLVNQYGERISVWKTNGRTLVLQNCWIIKQ